MQPDNSQPPSEVSWTPTATQNLKDLKGSLETGNFDKDFDKIFPPTPGNADKTSTDQ